jgi:hypothetical protein
VLTLISGEAEQKQKATGIVRIVTHLVRRVNIRAMSPLSDPEGGVVVYNALLIEKPCRFLKSIKS